MTDTFNQSESKPAGAQRVCPGWLPGTEETGQLGEESIMKLQEGQPQRTALETLLRSARYNVTQIDADLAKMGPVNDSEGGRMWVQGYQQGRKAELETLITTLEMVL